MITFCNILSWISLFQTELSVIRFYFAINFRYYFISIGAITMLGVRNSLGISCGKAGCTL